MIKYAIEELATFETNERGELICPGGDYSQIKIFKEKCSFGGECLFGSECSFGNSCSFDGSCFFGEACDFGAHCYFSGSCNFADDCTLGNFTYFAWCSGPSFGKHCCVGDHCSLDDYCSFGEHCIFGAGCSFGEGCSLGERCIFGAGCSFGEGCSLGERCIFGEHCSFHLRRVFGRNCSFGKHCRFVEIKEDIDRIIQIDGVGSENRCIYFYKTKVEMYMWCEDFFGTMVDFERDVKCAYKDKGRDLNEYLRAIKYVATAFQSKVSTNNQSLIEK